jgi:single-strand DNA-binding protein
MASPREGARAPNNCDNYVFLGGRLAAAPQLLELPSGDEVCSFRVVVDLAGPATVKVDTLECRTSAARVRGILERAEPGSQVELHGSIRRRLWRGAGGVRRRYEVEVGRAEVAKVARRRR